MNRKTFVRLAVCLALVAALSVPASAQEELAYPLSLRDCQRMALANNLDLVSARLDPDIAELGVVTEGAFFDPALSAGYNHSESEQEISNAFSLNQSTQDVGVVSVDQTVKFGANYSADLNMGRFEQSGPLVSVPSNYSSNLNLNVTVPLLNGRGELVNTERLVLAQGNLEISREQLRADAHFVLESVEGAYWDLTAAIEAVRIAKLSLKRAGDLLVLNRKRVEVGTLAPIEITQAEAGVASQEEGVIVAEIGLENAEDNLLRLLATPEADPMWDARLMPTDPLQFTEVETDLESSLDTAMAERPEVLNARQTLRNRELSEQVARRNQRHNLDLVANYRPNGNNFETTFDPGPDGVLGTPDDGPTSTVLDGALTTSLSEILDLENYQWSVGVNYRYPIGNHAAKANYQIASLNRQKADLGVQNEELGIRVEVRSAVRSVESGVKRVRAAQANTLLQQKKLEAEQKKLENGMSTSFEVLTFQDDLANAELAEVLALRDYVKALVALERTQGTLLQARGLSLD